MDELAMLRSVTDSHCGCPAEEEMSADFTALFPKRIGAYFWLYYRCL